MDDGFVGLMIGLLGGIFIMLVIIFTTTNPRIEKNTIEKVRLEAIENNVGEYYLDENHDKQFRWVDCQDPIKLKTLDR